jgi:predicted regulator of Ras-like GTPase activity (Roadblock/LC7/MglB family)
MSDHLLSRAARLDRALVDLLTQAPELEAAAVVSFDGLAMASSLPDGMDEDRVAAMSAALLSLGERAAQGLGRGDLSQVYVEGESGTVFLISCDNEAVLVAVAHAGAKAGLMLFEVRRAAADIAAVLRQVAPVPEPEIDVVAMAEAESAYAAHRAAEAARLAGAGWPVTAAPVPVLEPMPVTSPLLLPAESAAPAPAMASLPAAFLPEPGLEPLTVQVPTPSMSLAPWDKPAPQDTTWS